jgi:hypothetical protein
MFWTYLGLFRTDSGALKPQGRRWERLTEQKREGFEINTIGQAIVTAAFRPLLAKSTVVVGTTVSESGQCHHDHV